jgi:hypothetical protein
MAISVWQEKAERARAQLARLREGAKSAITHARRDGETIAAGALAGAVRGAFEASGKEYVIPGPNGMKIAPEVPAGLLLLAVAYSGQTDVSLDLHAMGAGVLAYSAGRELEHWMRMKGTKLPGAVQ